jgi:hypothetical protein
MQLSEKKATLSFSDDSASVEFPVYQGTIGPDVIDIRKLYGQTGMFTYDPGFLATASCESAITYIDGDKGQLLYRGYPIEQLAEKCDFMDVSYLILNGDLPDVQQKQEFDSLVTHHTMVHEQLHLFMRGFRRDAHPMAVLTGLVGALSAFYHDSTDITNPRHREISAIRLIAKMPTLVAMAYKYNQGQPYIYPRNDLSYTGNFLRMMFATPCEDYQVNDVVERALDRIFILHADHEQNASTSTVRLCGSSGTNPFAAIAAGVACLWGPAHGGANEACLQMLEQIQAEGLLIANCIRTLISIRVLFSARLVFPRRYLQQSLPWPAQLAGLPSGTKCCPTPSTRLAVRASCIRALKFATLNVNLRQVYVMRLQGGKAKTCVSCKKAANYMAAFLYSACVSGDKRTTPRIMPPTFAWPVLPAAHLPRPGRSCSRYDEQWHWSSECGPDVPHPVVQGPLIRRCCRSFSTCYR